MSTSAYDLDQQTRSQIEAIENEIKENQPLTTDHQPLSTLMAIYNKSGCGSGNDEGNASSNTGGDNFIKGCEYLNEKYTSWRSIRGDGNCYYRAFLYAVCEQLLRGSSDNDLYKNELKRLQGYVQGSIDEVAKFGYDRFTIETFHEELVDLFTFVGSSSSSSNSEAAKALHTKLTEENSTSDYCTWYLRVITSAYLKSDADRFVHFLDDPNYFDVETFCSREVDPMGKECGMVQVLALAEAMGVRVCIEYLDGRELTTVNSKVGDTASTHGKEKLTMHEFGPDKNSLEVALLYRPGHYDILYSSN